MPEPEDVEIDLKQKITAWTSSVRLARVVSTSTRPNQPFV